MKVAITKKDCFYEDGTKRDYVSIFSCPLHAALETFFSSKHFTVGGNAISFKDNYTPMMYFDGDSWNSDVMDDLMDGKIQSVELELTTKL